MSVHPRVRNPSSVALLQVSFPQEREAGLNAHKVEWGQLDAGERHEGKELLEVRRAQEQKEGWR